MKLQVVACMHGLPKEHYYARVQCLMTLERFGVKPIILGQEPYRWHWGGLGSKAKFLKRAIEEGVLTAEYIIFTDTYDVLYAGHPEQVLERFIAMNREPIIWGAERACFSDASLAPLHPETPSSFKYLNSGWGIGRLDAIKSALDEMQPENIKDDYQDEEGVWHHENDQNAWMRQMLFGTVPIGVDSGCQLVQNLSDVKEHELEVVGDKMLNMETGSRPLVWHANGGAKEIWLPTLLRSLGLPQTTS